MTILVHYHASQLTGVSANGWSCFPTNDVFPPEVKAVETTAQALNFLDDYVARVNATGKPAVVSFFKSHRSPKGGRKPAGFDKASRKPVLLNADKLTGEAA